MSVRKTASGIDMKKDQDILPEDVDRGRRFVLLIIVFTLGHCVEAVLSNLLAAGASNASWGSAIVRIVLAVTLCIFLYRRAMWARWVFGALSAIGGLGYSTMVVLQFIGILRPLYGGEPMSSWGCRLDWSTWVLEQLFSSRHTSIGTFATAGRRRFRKGWRPAEVFRGMKRAAARYDMRQPTPALLGLVSLASR